MKGSEAVQFVSQRIGARPTQCRNVARSTRQRSARVQTRCARNYVSICTAARASGSTSRLYCGFVRDRGTVRTSATKVTPELHSSFANASIGRGPEPSSSIARFPKECCPEQGRTRSSSHTDDAQRRRRDMPQVRKRATIPRHFRGCQFRPLTNLANLLHHATAISRVTKARRHAVSRGALARR